MENNAASRAKKKVMGGAKVKLLSAKILIFVAVVVENAVEWSQKGHQRCEEVTEAACGSSSAPGTALQDSPKELWKCKFCAGGMG